MPPQLAASQASPAKTKEPLLYDPKIGFDNLRFLTTPAALLAIASQLFINATLALTSYAAKTSAKLEDSKTWLLFAFTVSAIPIGYAAKVWMDRSTTSRKQSSLSEVENKSFETLSALSSDTELDRPHLQRLQTYAKDLVATTLDEVNKTNRMIMTQDGQMYSSFFGAMFGAVSATASGRSISRHGWVSGGVATFMVLGVCFSYQQYKKPSKMILMLKRVILFKGKGDLESNKGKGPFSVLNQVNGDPKLGEEGDDDPEFEYKVNLCKWVEQAEQGKHKDRKSNTKLFREKEFKQELPDIFTKVVMPLIPVLAVGIVFSIQSRGKNSHQFIESGSLIANINTLTATAAGAFSIYDLFGAIAPINSMDKSIRAINMIPNYLKVAYESRRELLLKEQNLMKKICDRVTEHDERVALVRELNKLLLRLERDYQESEKLPLLDDE